MNEAVPLDQYDTALERGIDALRAGQLIVLPTDTVYALLADAFNPTATTRLRSAKRRGRREPFGVVIRGPRQVMGIVSDIPEPADRLMAAYWPGPLTLVLPAAEGLTWDLGDTGGTVAMRMPVDELTHALIAEVGPLACTGANRKNEPLGSTLVAARAQLGDDVALYVDDGPRTGVPSTVVDLTGPAARVLRPGPIPAEHVQQVASGALAWGQQPAASLSDPIDPGTDDAGTTAADEEQR